MTVQLTVLTNSLAFVGKELGKTAAIPVFELKVASNPIAGDKDFMKSALDFIEDTLLTAETVRLLPQFLAR